ncbi:hypothetical protein K443DRAFT_674265 [Laccaria amethystina LaAM-08-1]|jgi:hypothetical protein|uniref:Uncharacterized protein n=1 Tax=Laccaria amethystina LaAM-08-1 TaxID=1095629 RepID=A0A0C9XY88_9AGAR|nr:hypothetical protein K443DRAFT_674265 [Laccaria amethystina LaAM-08-1]
MDLILFLADWRDAFAVRVYEGVWIQSSVRLEGMGGGYDAGDDEEYGSSADR